MKRSDFRHFERLRVRWAEVDMQRIVFNGHYLAYVDTAVGGYWRALALPYQDTMAGLGGDLFVRKATLEYHDSALYDDLLEVGVRHTRTGNSSLSLSAGVFRGEQLLVGAELVYVFADPVLRRPLAVPPVLRDVFSAFERGEAMVNVAVGDALTLGEQTAAIRAAVFQSELGIDARLERDAADAAARHALAVNRLGKPLATGRLVETSSAASIGRLAVIQPMRGCGVGRAVLEALIQEAQRLGYAEVSLEALRSAENFYKRSGFEPDGEPYQAAGQTHLRMRRALR